MHLLIKLTTRQQGFVQSTTAAAAEILADKRKRGEHGEAFQSQQDLAPSLALNFREQFEITFE